MKEIFERHPSEIFFRYCKVATQTDFFEIFSEKQYSTERIQTNFEWWSIYNINKDNKHHTSETYFEAALGRGNAKVPTNTNPTQGREIQKY